MIWLNIGHFKRGAWLQKTKTAKTAASQLRMLSKEF